eukprot:6345465-Prymnesium_polylepis.1
MPPLEPPLEPHTAPTPTWTHVVAVLLTDAQPLTHSPRPLADTADLVQRSAASSMRLAHLDPVPLTLAGAPTLLR